MTWECTTCKVRITDQELNAGKADEHLDNNIDHEGFEKVGEC